MGWMADIGEEVGRRDAIADAVRVCQTSIDALKTGAGSKYTAKERKIAIASAEWCRDNIAKLR